MRFIRNLFPFLAMAALGIAVCAGSASACPQSQGDSSQSVAEAARKAKEQKKKSDKPAKTITDEDLAAKKAAAAKEGAAAEAAGGEGFSGRTTSGRSGCSPSQRGRKRQTGSRTERFEAKTGGGGKGLDLLQREYALQREQFYSNPNYARDSVGKAKLDDLQNQIRDKQQDVDQLKTRVAALQELIDRAKAASPEKSASPPGS